jgi:hypothetical protein
LLAFPIVLSYSQFQLNGKIVDINDQPIKSVTIIENGQKALSMSDDNGNFKIQSNSGNRICFSHLSYFDTCINLNSLVSNPIKIVLQEKNIFSKDVLVSAKSRNYNIKSTQSGLFEVHSDSIRHLPGIVGEGDPMKLLQLTPGVTVNEVGMGINVRGSSTDQNMVILDDVIICNPAHILGFFSIFNPLIVNKVSLIKSGIPSYYGNRFSSVTEISTKKEITDKLGVEGNVGILSTDLAIQTPVIDRKAGISIAFRKSYIDYTIKPLSRILFKKNRSMFSNSFYGFYDSNFGITYYPGINDRIYLNAYAGSDDYKLYKASFDINNYMNWKNYSISAKWMHYFTSQYVMKTTCYYSGSDFTFYLGQKDYNFYLFSKLSDVSFLHEHSFFQDKYTLRAGINASRQYIEPNHCKMNIYDLDLKFGTPNNFNTVTLSSYIHSEINITEKLSVMAGIRGSKYLMLGPYDRFIRQYGQEISDTIHYATHRIVNDFFYFEPRFSARYSIDDRTSVKISATRNIQYLQQVNVSSVSLPTDFWIPANYYLLPLVGYQFSAGYFKNSVFENIDLSIELFYKQMNHLPEFKKGVLSTVTKISMEENLVSGKGRAYGCEVLIRRNIGKINGWISYTLSRTERIFETINDGKPFPAKYDRTHDISIIAEYKISSTWEASAIFVFATGNAFTLPSSRYLIGGNLVNDYTAYNSFRMPSYHRLDISITRLLKQYKSLEHSINFSIYNVYSRLNPYYMYYGVSGNLQTGELKVKPKLVSVFPLIPSVSYSFKF